MPVSLFPASAPVPCALYFSSVSSPFSCPHYHHSAFSPLPHHLFSLAPHLLTCLFHHPCISILYSVLLISLTILTRQALRRNCCTLASGLCMAPPRTTGIRAGGDSRRLCRRISAGGIVHGGLRGGDVGKQRGWPPLHAGGSVSSLLASSYLDSGASRHPLCAWYQTAKAGAFLNRRNDSVAPLSSHGHSTSRDAYVWFRTTLALIDMVACVAMQNVAAVWALRTGL